VARLILVLNAGSSSLKASLVRGGSDESSEPISVPWGDNQTATFSELLTTLDVSSRRVGAVAHRVVHGGSTFTRPVIIDDRIMSELEATAELAPLHNAAALELIGIARARLSKIPHVACFDTAFHTTIPEVAWRYPVPYEWADDWGIRRYGFHGLSVAWSVRKAAELMARPAATLSLIVAHLGSGCSVTAVEDGKSIWTSMGFTPLEGLMMGTRSGSIDPGVVLHLLRTAVATPHTLAEALERRSGLLGVSGTTADMRALAVAAESGDERSSIAREMFVARAAEGIAAAMTWVIPDAVIFTGGIGEHDIGIRDQVMARLPFATCPVTVVEAREDLVMAQAATLLIGR
jgi:acetate kinase